MQTFFFLFTPEKSQFVQEEDEAVEGEELESFRIPMLFWEVCEVCRRRFFLWFYGFWDRN